MGLLTYTRFASPVWAAQHLSDRRSPRITASTGCIL